MIYGSDWVGYYSFLAFVGGVLSAGVLYESRSRTRSPFDFDIGDLLNAWRGSHGPGAKNFLESISFRTLVLSLTVFGIVGLCLSFVTTANPAKIISMLAGLTTFYLEMWYRRAAEIRKARQPVWNAHNAVGMPARVTMTIPGGGIGEGMVAVQVGQEIKTVVAISDGAGYQSGDVVLVARALDANRVAVSAVQQRPTATA